jgi:hypothetical protein
MRVAVLGLGPSISLFNPDGYDLSIGVNDIWRYYKSDVIVCLDKRSVFAGERLITIENSRPIAFYSQIVNWDSRPEFQKIEFLHNYPDQFCNLDLPQYNKSYCSPFVACQIAWRVYGADEIHLYGVDLTNHKHLDHKLCAKIKTHFRHLKTALTAKGCKLVIHGEGILKDL